MTPLDRIWRDLHDPTTWPPPPERPLRPVTYADLAAMLPTAADLARWGLRPNDRPAVDGDRPAVKGRAA